MKVRKKIGDLGKAQIQQLVQDFLDELDEGAVALLEHFEESDSPEFLEVEVDEENKILSFTRKDGSHYVYNLSSETIDALAERISALEQAPGNENFENIEDIEGRLQIGKDAEDKIFNYRKPDGTLVENAGIETNHLELTTQGMSDFQQALKDAGFTPGGGGDWTDRDTIELPEPKHYALLNINIDSLPTASGDVREADIQYYDGLGNSFKMNAEIEIQGQSSRNFAQTGGKGNYTLDLAKDIKFGNWVPQDSFHLKGAAKDVTRGILPTSYKWAYLMQEFLGSAPNRVLIDESGISETSATGKRINDWPTDARCLPDGFPVEVYVNGEYHGLFSWQLKKHRKNYSMDKKDYTSFFLDADAMMTDDYQHGLWNDSPDDKTYRATGWWTGFDIKGPKDLIIMDGSEFDGDAPQELMSKYTVTLNALCWAYTGKYIDVDGGTEPTSELWNSATAYAAGDKCYFLNDDMQVWIQFVATEPNTNEAPLILAINSAYNDSDKKHKGSRTTKNLIRKMSLRYNEIKGYITDGDTATAKAKFNEYFDYDACMLVYIYNSLMYNTDSVKKNTLWGMYNSGKIFPMLWDLDNMYGENHSGAVCVRPSTNIWNIYHNAAWPLALFWTLYETEIRETYNALRNAKIINVETWHDIVFNQWVNRIGEEAYNRDIEKWPETPSYRENYTDTENWVQVGWRNNISSTLIWDETTSYSVGDEAALRSYTGKTEGVVYKAVKANVGSCPVTDFYNAYPVVGGFYDSPKRWEKWISKQIELCDQFVGYTE